MCSFNTLLDMKTKKNKIRIVSRWISPMMILTWKIQFQYFYWAKMLSFSSIPFHMLFFSSAIIITFNPISLIWPNRIMIMQSYKILNVQFLIFIDNKHFCIAYYYVRTYVLHVSFSFSVPILNFQSSLSYECNTYIHIWIWE